MSQYEFIALAAALFLGISTYLNHRRLKKRFDILESMLGWKNILNSEETKWDNLPDEVKKNIREWNKLW